MSSINLTMEDMIMRTKTLQLMLTALLGLTLAGPASAQNRGMRGSFVIDGNPEEWGGD